MNNLIYIDNNGDVQSFSCEGQTINISGNAVFDGEETYNVITPILNYIDQDNQFISEQYNSNQLYLSGKYVKTYTGGSDNYYLLTPYVEEIQNVNASRGIVLSGIGEGFDYSGTISTDGLSGNLFTNFTDNALNVLLSNIPGYIQYVFIFGCILFILGLAKRLKGRRK